jgi:hypothetical protein
MKSQRRHDLKQNVLGTEISKGINFLKRRGTLIAWGVLLIVAAVFGYVWLTSRTQSKDEDVQVRFRRLEFNARGAVDGTDVKKREDALQGFKDLAEQDRIPRIAAQSTLKVADLCATRAFSAGADVRERQRLTDDARVYYRRAVDRFAQFPVFVARGHIGLARLADSAGDLATAKQEYQAAAAITDPAAADLARLAQASLEKVDAKRLRPMATTMPKSPPTSRPTTRVTSRPASRPATQPKP